MQSLLMGYNKSPVAFYLALPYLHPLNFGLGRPQVAPFHQHVQQHPLPFCRNPNPPVGQIFYLAAQTQFLRPPPGTRPEIHPLHQSGYCYFYISHHFWRKAKAAAPNPRQSLRYRPLRPQFRGFQVKKIPPRQSKRDQYSDWETGLHGRQLHFLL